EALDEGPHPGKPWQCFGAVWPWWKTCDGLFEQNACAVGVAGLEVTLSGFDASLPRSWVVRSGEPTRPFPELRCALWRPARPRSPGCVVERRGNLRVGTGRGESKMPCAFVGLVDDLREPGVQRTLLGSGRLGVDDRSKQRMREGDPPTAFLENPRFARAVEAGCRHRLSGGGRNDRHRRPGQRRHHAHDLA